MAEIERRKRPLLSSDPEDQNDVGSDEDEYLVPRKRQRSDHKATSEILSPEMKSLVLHDSFNALEFVSC